MASGERRRLGPAAADSIPACRRVRLPALCRRRRPETAERDLIRAWLLPQLRSVRSPVAPVGGGDLVIVIGVDVRPQRHRLDRGGNRQLNCALYRIASTQARYHPPARAYLERKQTEGKSRREAIRCLKRTLIRVVFNTLKATPALT